MNGTLDLNDDWTLRLTGPGFLDGGSLTIFTYDTLAASPDLAPTFDTSLLGFIPSSSLSLFDNGSGIDLIGVSVPEPSIFVLAALGTLSLCFVGSRRRRPA